MKTKVAVCASGEGTNFEALVEASRTGVLQAEIVGLPTNRGNIGAIHRAERLRVPWRVIDPKLFALREDWDQAMLDTLQEWQTDWVALAGFLALVGPKVLRQYARRIVNSHPALLPNFGGAGMYGDRVHQAVLAAGAVETGITIHTIDEVYDRGQIVAQERVPVLQDDTVTTLAARVKAREVLFYPKVLNDLVTGRITTG